ncbi:MAG: CPBP family intramembrane metalloprotease [Planctomycetales bacterium]
MNDEPSPNISAEDERIPRGTLVLMAVLVEGGMFVLALIFGALAGHGPLEGMRWSPRDFGVALLATTPLLVLLLIVTHVPFGPLRRLQHTVQSDLVPLFRECTLLDLAIISLLAGLGEEALFRGFLQPWIGGWTSPLMGWVAASVLFGLAHLVTVTYAVLAMLMGLYLGWLWLAVEKNLLVVILVHGLYDFAAFVYLLKFHQQPKEIPED